MATQSWRRFARVGAACGLVRPPARDVAAGEPARGLLSVGEMPSLVFPPPRLPLERLRNALLRVRGGWGGVLLQTLCPWRRDTWLLAARCLLGSSGLRDVAAPSFPQTGPPCPVSLHTPVWQSPSPPGSVSPVSRV